MESIINNKVGGFRSFFLSLIVLVFFSLALISMGVNFISETNPNSEALKPIGDNQENFTLYSIKNNLDGSFDNVTRMINNSKENLAAASASPLEYLFVIVKETVSIPIDLFGVMFGLIGSLTSSFTNLLSAQLGLPPILSTGITLLFYGIWVIAILLTIRLIRSGQD